VDKYSTLYGKIVDADGNVVKADADARRDTPPERRKVCLRRCLLDAPDMARDRDARRTIPRPGRRASHGCIRLPRQFAVQLFELVRIGTPVQIIR
jgi:hypothetical protein